MRSNLERLSKNLCCNEGATAIEYAIVLPILLLLVLGIIEYSLVMYGTATLEGATIEAAREGKTGYTQAGLTQQQYVYNIAQNRVSGLLDPSKLNIVVKYYANFQNIGQLEPCLTAKCGNGLPNIDYQDINGDGVWDDQGVNGLGNGGSVVEYTISYPWSIITPFLSNYLGTNGIYTLRSSAIVKNEPYSGTGR